MASSTGLERLGGAGKVAMMDFGSGMGQTGLSFAAAGYETVFVDVVDKYLDFVRFLAKIRDSSRRSFSRPPRTTSTTPQPMTGATG